MVQGTWADELFPLSFLQDHMKSNKTNVPIADMDTEKLTWENA